MLVLRFKLFVRTRTIYEYYKKTKMTFKSPYRVMIKVVLNAFPFEVFYKNGQKILIRNLYELKSFARDFILEHYEFKWTNPRTGILIRLRGSKNDVIANAEYRWLPVEGKTVVDIGANIGDSSEYFVSERAKEVLAFEPYPYSYRIALSNIELNDHRNKIKLYNAAVSGSSGVLSIDPDFHNTVGSSVDASQMRGGVRVPILTLSDILKMCNSTDIALKIDCEGCEYSSLRMTSAEDLRRFSHIQMEYHYGPEEIVSKLRDAGFDVTYTKPKYSLNPDAKLRQAMYSGMIYAVRK